MLSLLLSVEIVLLGTLAGFIAGLLNIHTNMVALLIASAGFDAWFSVLFLVSFAVSRSVSDALPTVFISASEDVLSFQHAFQLLKKGNGAKAVYLSVFGSLLGCIVSIVASPLFFLVYPLIVEIMRPILFWLLLALVLFLLFDDQFWSIVVFALSGILGILTLDSVPNSLFPLLSGLFGASNILLSLNKSIPAQKVCNSKLNLSYLRPAVEGVLAGATVLLFPGLGPSQAAALIRSSSFLVVTGALGTADVILSILAFASAGKTRNGAVVVLESLIGNLSFSSLAALLSASLVSVGIACLVVFIILPYYSKLFELLNYKIICLCVLIMISSLSFIFSGFLGLLVLVTATATGFIAPILGIRRSHAMGCLLIPTLIMLW